MAQYDGASAAQLPHYQGPGPAVSLRSASWSAQWSWVPDYSVPAREETALYSSLGPGRLQRMGRRGFLLVGGRRKTYVKGSRNLYSNRDDSYFIANMETEGI